MLHRGLSLLHYSGVFLQISPIVDYKRPEQYLRKLPIL